MSLAKAFLDPIGEQEALDMVCERKFFVFRHFVVCQFVRPHLFFPRSSVILPSCQVAPRLQDIVVPRHAASVIAVLRSVPVSFVKTCATVQADFSVSVGLHDCVLAQFMP